MVCEGNSGLDSSLPSVLDKTEDNLIPQFHIWKVHSRKYPINDQLPTTVILLGEQITTLKES